jgi:glycosyltransferase 2 family protein
MMNWQKSIQFILLLAIGVVLIYFSIHKLSITSLFETIAHGNFIVVIPVFIVSVFGYYIRSLRWRLLLKSVHQPVPASHLFACLSMGYAVNFATPRLGEIARCLTLKKVSEVPIEQSLMSVIVERLIDVITLLILVLLSASMFAGETSVFVQHQIILPIVNELSQFNNGVIGLIFLISVLCFGGFGWLVWRYAKWQQWFKKMVNSIYAMLKLPQKGLFMFYTLLIWSCYFLMTYLWFYTFSETQILGLKEAFLIMVIGSIGRSVPIQGGGMGAYHYLVSHALLLFNISLTLGNALAFIIHGAQLILTFVLGLVSWVWMMWRLKIST